MRNYFVPVTVLIVTCIYHILSHLVSTTTRWCRHCYHSPLTWEGSEEPAPKCPEIWKDKNPRLMAPIPLPGGPSLTFLASSSAILCCVWNSISMALLSEFMALFHACVPLQLHPAALSLWVSSGSQETVTCLLIREAFCDCFITSIGAAHSDFQRAFHMSLLLVPTGRVPLRVSSVALIKIIDPATIFCVCMFSHKL